MLHDDLVRFGHLDALLQRRRRTVPEHRKALNARVRQQQSRVRRRSRKPDPALYVHEFRGGHCGSFFSSSFSGLTAPSMERKFSYLNPFMRSWGVSWYVDSSALRTSTGDPGSGWLTPLTTNASSVSAPKRCK